MTSRSGGGYRRFFLPVPGHRGGEGIAPSLFSTEKKSDGIDSICHHKLIGSEKYRLYSQRRAGSRLHE